MKTIKAIVVDDETHARENLIGILNTYCPQIEVLCEASSAIDAINEIEKCQPNLVFLDIEMPGGNGFQVLEHFSTIDFKIIFVTAYDQYAIQAIRFAALDYILKPINILQLKAAIKRFSELKDHMDKRLETFLKNNQASIEHKKIAFPSAEKIEFIEIKQIVRLQGEANYTKVFLSGNENLLVSKPLIEYEEILENHGFLRTHKTHLVNTAHISSYIKTDGGYLQMSDGASIPVARRKKEYILGVLKEL